MKDQWSISKDKLVALEEGTSRNEEHECPKPAGRRNVCEQAIQCVKLILYLGLLMIVGWACYSMWQTYHAQPIEVKVTGIIPEPESQNLLEEQRTHETSTIAARPIYESEDSSKRQDAVDDLQKFVPDDQAGIIISENTESSLGWPNYTDYPDLPEAMNFSLFFPSLPSMEVDEKEPGSSDSAQRLFDNLNEESQQLIKDEKGLLENYMLLSLIVQNAVRISERLKDSKEVVDPKFEFKLEDLGPLKLEDSSRLELDNSGLLEMKNTGPLDFEDLGPFEWMDSGPLESQKDIGSDLEDSEEKPVSKQTDDNHESATLNILDNTHEIVPEDSAEAKQEETLIKSNEQMHQSMDSGVADWFDESAFEEREHEKEQSLLEKTALRNAEAVEDSSEDIFHNVKLTWADLSPLEDSGSSEFEDSGVIKLVDFGAFEWMNSDRLASKDLLPLEWEDSGPLESQKDIGSDLEDSEEKPVSKQTDDNHESATLNILDNTHEIVPEDSAEAKQEETLIKSNEQMHQSLDSGVVEWILQRAFEKREHEGEQSLLEKRAVRNAEAVEDSSEEIFHNVKPTSAVVRRLEDSGPLEFEDSGPLESQKDIGSDLEDSEEKPVSKQTDDNHESATLNILDNTHDIVLEDSAEPKQEEALIKSNKQTRQWIFSVYEDWLRRALSSVRNHIEDRATETIASDGTEAEVEDGEIPRTPFDFGDSIGNTNSFLGLRSDAGGSSVKTESAKESESDRFDWETYESLLTRAQIACLDAILYSWGLVDPEDTNNSHGSGVQDKCTERTKTFCEYQERTLQLADCGMIGWHDPLRGLAHFN